MKERMRCEVCQGDLTADSLREVLRYDPSTGQFFWLRHRHVKMIGREAVVLSRKGEYCRVRIAGRRYMRSRLAWLYMTGSWPAEEVDHKNRTRDDDRWENLREANRSQQTANQKIRSVNTNGHPGVWFNKRKNRFHARIMKDGRRQSLGGYATLEEAGAAYRIAAGKLFGEYAADAL